ncbi:SAM and SH3 domain-containing protein [Actinidia chinensis var. chinensis]|uniref:SAM and SH3 domain-containing protein n=1 Tax=Actinidia chinensis var. chinensis TaxID=1590841 RepID=A0A2R6PBH7_ACTCC|nr:SAM and SH3 domain-containing protein [Actinidia chinensis var. chinensis]
MWEDISVNYVLEKLREKGRDLAAENSMNYVPDKLKEWLMVVVNFGGSLIGKVDEMFPPKTREEQLRRWLQVATPFIISAVVLLLCICCSRCGGGREVKMMKAPGGRSKRMPRHVFEGNPKSYFRGLRGKPV